MQGADKYCGYIFSVDLILRESIRHRGEQIIPLEIAEISNRYFFVCRLPLAVSFCLPSPFLSGVSGSQKVCIVAAAGQGWHARVRPVRSIEASSHQDRIRRLLSC
jgi:hypothetical protein